MYPLDIREESLKLHVAKDYFANYDTADILGNIDFSVAVPQKGLSLFDKEYLLWAEAKQGNSHDIFHSFVQLILTIGKAHSYDHYLPPKFLGAFDAERIAFIEYHRIVEVFYINDFKWNVTPSDHNTKEFQLLLEKVQSILQYESLIFNFDNDDKLLKKFIRQNFVIGKERIAKTQVTKNNFVAIFNRWLSEVFPSINITDETLKQLSMVAADFYLADILSREDYTLHDKLFALLRSNHYDLINRLDTRLGLDITATAQFKDEGKAHRQFWAKYQRPPKREYWGYILERRDLLVPQDIRERKGSFFTPRIWVEKAQEYLADTLGENWQDEYYIWDCCAGTGNLLAGLTNKYNIWASTIDEPDVKVMHDQITHGLNLIDSHIFQFDFLNDPFSKLPQSLRDVIEDEEKRRKLVIFINPPYAEGDNRNGIGRAGVAANTQVAQKYAQEMGYGKRELFVQFIARIYYELPSVVLAEFSTLKILQAPNFREFRKNFRAKLESFFLVPANTFDNVKGDFPISFKIWNTAETSTPYQSAYADVYDDKGTPLGKKIVACYDGCKFINDWTLSFIDDTVKPSMGTIIGIGNDYQNQRTVRIEKPYRPWNHQYQWQITPNNIIQSSIYLAVRHCIDATWLNDRDQFLLPTDDWQYDYIFQTDCLFFTMFHGQNRVTEEDLGGQNHWNPFSENEVHPKDNFASHFMHDFVNGKIAPTAQHTLFAEQQETKPVALVQYMSDAAKDVYNAAKELYAYYHAQPDSSPNATFYDIRKYFQGIDNKGRMNSDSNDEQYTLLIRALRSAQKTLAARIAEKVYEYGFLK